MPIVQDEYKVGELESDLPAEAASDRGNGARGTPRAVGEARDDKTAAETPRAEEAGLEYSDDSQALCIGQDGWRDDLVGAEGLARVDEGGENLAALLTFRCRSKSRTVSKFAISIPASFSPPYSLLSFTLPRCHI